MRSPPVDPREAQTRANVIPMHPDFRMLVLANRPGFPFLGNDFFGSLGSTPTHAFSHRMHRPYSVSPNEATAEEECCMLL